jgi:hypothetical protein
MGCSCGRDLPRSIEDRKNGSIIENSRGANNNFELINKLRKEKCKQCHGTSICIHDKEKAYCRECFVYPQNFCSLCTFVFVKGCPYYPYCFRCYCYTNPNEKIPRRFKMKENYINDFLKDYYPDIINDKPISNLCSSKKRPDWYIELFTHSIIIECDENQHNKYSCENKRMMQIFEDLGNRPIVFIRFNPDKYEINGCKYKECFYYSEDNKLQINKQECDKRLKKLLEIIKQNESIPDKEVTIINLFYS